MRPTAEARMRSMTSREQTDVINFGSRFDVCFG